MAMKVVVTSVTARNEASEDTEWISLSGMLAQGFASSGWAGLLHWYHLEFPRDRHTTSDSTRGLLTCPTREQPGP